MIRDLFGRIYASLAGEGIIRLDAGDLRCSETRGSIPLQDGDFQTSTDLERERKYAREHPLPTA